MPQPKGKTGNPVGRPKGIPNRTTSELRAWVQTLVERNEKKFTADLKKLEPYQRLLILEKLMGFVLPKLQSVDVQTQTQIEYTELRKLLEVCPDELLDELTNRIINLKKTDNGTARV